MIENIISLLESKLDSKRDALPSGFNATRFLQNSAAYLKEVKGMKASSVEAAAAALFQGAVLGLDFLSKECHLITDRGVDFQTDYKGEKKLAKKYSVRPVMDIYAKNVREGDDFREEIIDGRPTVTFTPLPFNNSPFVGTFAVCLFADGGMVYETMTADEIEAVRKHYGKNPNSQTWEKSQGEMYKRTVLRRLCKNIELDFGADQIYAFDEGSNFDVKAAPRPVVNSPLNAEESEGEEEANETDS